MNCKKCGFNLVNGQDICPRCGASQSDAQEATQGISMELPTMETPVEKKPDKKVKKTPEKKAKKAVKKEKPKIEEEMPTGTDVENPEEEPNKEGSKNWLYAVIGIAAAAVIIVIAFLVIGYEPKGGDDENFVILATTEDEIFLVEGQELTEIAELPEDIYASEVITAVDAKNFYLLTDTEYNDESGQYIGDLVYLKSNGKETDIDSDVIVGTQTLVGDILWYEKADREDKIICCYDGKNVMEVIEEEMLSTWYGTDKAGKAYYSIMDEDDYTTEVFLIENEDETSIMDEAQIVAVSSDYKKVVLVVEDDGESIVNIFDGKDDFEVMEDVQDILINSKTLDMLVISDEEDMMLYYIPYGKEPIEIDDEVERIVPLTIQSNTYSYMVEDLGSKIYYGKNEDLYVADFKGKDNDRILKDYEEVSMIDFDYKSMTLTYVDDDEVVTFNLNTLKETSVELPDADELGYSDVALVGKWYVYRTEENEEILAYDGSKKDPLELSNDADEIASFEGFMDKYVLWINFDQELIISQMKEDTDDEIGDEIYDYWTTSDGQIYFLSDYEDGEGELYYISKVGKDAEKLEKDITDVIRVFYK